MSEFRKSRSRFGISILGILCEPIFRQKDTFEFVCLNLSKNGFWGGDIKNLRLRSESGHLRYYVHQFSDKEDNFEFLPLNLSKNGFSVAISKM